jgi:hypothetical protein
MLLDCWSAAKAAPAKPAVAIAKDAANDRGVFQTLFIIFFLSLDFRLGDRMAKLKICLSFCFRY